MRVLASIAAGLVLAAISAAAQQDPAGDYPNRPVRIIVNVTPGGGVDTATRIVAQRLSDRLGHPFVIENRGGGGGNPAAEAVYQSPPDGYTLLASSGSTISINDYLFKKLNFDPSAFEPVSVLTHIPLALIVRRDFPANNAKEFLAYVKANPGKLNYASQGIGTAGHLTAELFIMLTGDKLTHIPYKGTNPVLNDVLAGHVDLTFIQFSAFYEFHKAGRAKILAVATERRIDLLPDIPTMAEVGLPEIVSRTWNVISAPPKTPAPVLAKLNHLIGEILKERDVKERFGETVTVEGGDLAQTRKFVREDRELWGKVIKAAGLQPE